MISNVFPQKPNYLDDIFNVKKPIIGMIHLKALPGAPHYNGESMEEIFEFACKDAQAFKDGGADGLVVENAWDIPFAKTEDIGYETVTTMSILTKKLIEEFGMPVGVNCLANAVIPSLSVAKAAGAKFVRSNQWVNAYVANEGITDGASAKAARYRKSIYATDVKMFVDVHVKHGSHSIIADRCLKDQTDDNVFFDADVLIATGTRTGDATPVEEINGIKDHTRLPVIVGSGICVENASEIFKHADGAIIGTYFKYDNLWWNNVEQDKVKALMDVMSNFR